MTGLDLGPHAGFILASYGLSALIVGGLVLRAVLAARAQRRALVAFGGRPSEDEPRLAGPSLAASGGVDG